MPRRGTGLFGDDDGEAFEDDMFVPEDAPPGYGQEQRYGARGGFRSGPGQQLREQPASGTKKLLVLGKGGRVEEASADQVLGTDKKAEEKKQPAWGKKTLAPEAAPEAPPAADDSANSPDAAEAAKAPVAAGRATWSSRRVENMLKKEDEFPPLGAPAPANAKKADDFPPLGGGGGGLAKKGLRPGGPEAAHGSVRQPLKLAKPTARREEEPRAPAPAPAPEPAAPTGPENLPTKEVQEPVRGSAADDLVSVKNEKIAAERVDDAKVVVKREEAHVPDAEAGGKEGKVAEAPVTAVEPEVKKPEEGRRKWADAEPDEDEEEPEAPTEAAGAALARDRHLHVLDTAPSIRNASRSPLPAGRDADGPPGSPAGRSTSSAEGRDWRAASDTRDWRRDVQTTGPRDSPARRATGMRDSPLRQTSRDSPARQSARSSPARDWGRRSDRDEAPRDWRRADDSRGGGGGGGEWRREDPAAGRRENGGDWRRPGEDGPAPVRSGAGASAGAGTEWRRDDRGREWRREEPHDARGGGGRDAPDAWRRGDDRSRERDAPEVWRRGSNDRGAGTDPKARDGADTLRRGSDDRGDSRGADAWRRGSDDRGDPRGRDAPDAWRRGEDRGDAAGWRKGDGPGSASGSGGAPGRTPLNLAPRSTPR